MISPAAITEFNLVALKEQNIWTKAILLTFSFKSKCLSNRILVEFLEIDILKRRDHCTFASRPLTWFGQFNLNSRSRFSPSQFKVY
mmetsp:Transcript_3209/g.11466  ORF Transcript_3209/g.11466 Transcript_3209/m.11466 type:complete len:86 (+) Transcript_3209:3272-3529(+)